MVPSRLSLLLVAALLALGGVLLLTVEWFLLYFGSEPGRLFG